MRGVLRRPWEGVRGWLLWPMLWKEFVQMRRDRLTLGMMIGVPVLQLLLFGYAIRTEVRHLPLVVLDESRTQQSRALVAALANTGNFDVVGAATDRAAITHAVLRGEASAGLVIAATYASDLKRGRPAQAQLLVDASDPMASAAAISAASLTAMAHGMAVAGVGRAPAAAQGAGPITLTVRPWYNPALRSAVHIVPGIVGVLLSLTMLLVTSMAVVRERERGTLEQLVVTPIDKTSLMLGKLLPFAAVGYVQMTNVLLFGWLLFEVPMRGSLPLLYLLTAPFIVAMLGLGLLVSTLARNQAQAMQVGFFLMLPNILLSGFMFPREAMPEPAQWIGALLPLTYYLQVLRGVLLKDAGLEALWPDAAALTAFAVVLVAVSVRRFAKTLE